MSPTHYRALAFSLLVLSTGCSSAPPQPPPEDPAGGQLRKIGLAYMQVANGTGQPPRTANPIKDALRQMGEANPDSLLVSPNDGQPFTIVFGFDPRTGDTLPDSSAPPVILAYEQTGKDGQRWVLTTLCFAVRLGAEDFAKARFANGHTPR
jgi:hypothetical protein